MSKNYLVVSLVALVFGGGGFWGGWQFGQGQTNQPRVFQGLENISPDERQQIFRQFGAEGMRVAGRRLGGAQAGLGFVVGEVISNDGKSLTVKLRDGGSRIIFFSDSTSIGTLTQSSPRDLLVGKEVVVNGNANSDGSITAQSIQIRPTSLPSSADSLAPNTN